MFVCLRWSTVNGAKLLERQDQRGHPDGYREDNKEDDELWEEYRAGSQQTEDAPGGPYHYGRRKYIEGGQKKIEQTAADAAAQIEQQEFLGAPVTLKNAAEEIEANHVADDMQGM